MAARTASTRAIQPSRSRSERRAIGAARAGGASGGGAAPRGRGQRPGSPRDERRDVRVTVDRAPGEPAGSRPAVDRHDPVMEPEPEDREARRRPRIGREPLQVPPELVAEIPDQAAGEGGRPRRPRRRGRVRGRGPAPIRARSARAGSNGRPNGPGSSTTSSGSAVTNDQRAARPGRALSRTASPGSRTEGVGEGDGRHAVEVGEAEEDRVVGIHGRSIAEERDPPR